MSPVKIAQDAAAIDGMLAATARSLGAEIHAPTNNGLTDA
jgi:hypothetical protein